MRPACFPAANTGKMPNAVASMQKSTKSPGYFARAFRGKSGTLLLHFRILDPAGKWFGTFSPD
jgi:hypothetical protein